MSANKKKIFIFLGLVCLFLFLGISFAHALEIDYPRIPGAIPPQDLANYPSEQIFGLRTNYFFNLAIWMLGALALGVLIYGGIRYLTSTGKPEAMVSAKERISAAFLGMLILLSSWIILRTLNPQLIAPQIIELPTIEGPDFPETSPPPILEGLRTSIDTEVPLGKIIEERILETVVPAAQRGQRKSRMDRIKDIGSNSLTLATMLRDQSEELKSLAEQCSCSQAEPVCPGCRPLGTPYIGNVLNAAGLAQFSAITQNLSDIIGPENLSIAFEVSVNIADVVGNTGELSNVFGAIENIAEFVEFSADLTQVFETADIIADIATNYDDLTFLFGSIEDLTNIIGLPVDLGQVFEIAYAAADIVENPKDLFNVFGSIENITNIVGVSADLVRVFDVAYTIAAIAEDPTNLGGILSSVGNLMDISGTFENLDLVLDIADTVAVIAGNPRDLSTILLGIENLTGIIGIPADLAQVFDIAYTAANIVENPTDLTNILLSVEDLTHIVGVGENLSQVFDVAHTAAGMVENPNNLFLLIEEVGIAVGSPIGENIGRAFDVAMNIRSIVRNPRNVDNVLSSIGNLTVLLEIPTDLTRVFAIVEEVSRLAENPRELLGMLRARADFTIIIPSGNLEQVLIEIEIIANEVRYLDDLSDISRIVGEISVMVPLPSDIPIILSALEGIAAVIHDPTDLQNLKWAIEDLSDIIPISGSMPEVLESLAGITNVIRDPTDIYNLQVVVEDLSSIAPIPEVVPEILGSLAGITNVIRDPTDIYNLQVVVEDLSRVFPIPGDAINILGNLRGITAIINNPTDLRNVQLLVQDLSNIVPIPEDALRVLGSLGGITAIINNPTDLRNTQNLLRDLAQIAPQTGELADILDNFQGVAAIIRDPTDLRNIQWAMEDLANIIPIPQDFLSVLGELGYISDIIQNPTDIGVIMNSLEHLSGVIPLPQDLASVLGNLEALANIFPYLGDFVGSFMGKSCTCDPCKDARGEIQNTENENIKAMYLGTPIDQTNPLEQPITLTTSLAAEQKKAAQEIRLIKEEIGKLERAEEFMLECPSWSLSTLTELLEKKDEYLTKQWFLRDIHFWTEIMVEGDWATLYCPVSGTLWEERYSPEDTSEAAEIARHAVPSGLPGVGKPVPCSIGIPVGDIIERVRRTGYKLIERLEKIISLDEEMIKAVDKLHTLVSQCTSQAPRCTSICIPIFDDGDLVDCIERCVGSPCPYSEINAQVREINEILRRSGRAKEGIWDVVQAPFPADRTKIEEVGMITVIDQSVPKILEDLQNIIRYPIKRCVSAPESAKIVLDCRGATNGLGPEGRLIENCCYQESWYRGCSQECYLKIGQETYKTCMKACLEREAAQRQIEEISTCRHLINFYCCSI